MKIVLKPPSLEHMTLVKIAASLWNQNDVRVLVGKLSSSDLYSNTKWTIIEEIIEWSKIEDRIIAKVPHLSLPWLLQEKVLGFIKPIGLHIFEWMKFHRRYSFSADQPAELFWSPQGTIDRKKTAEMSIKDENLDLSTCYKLACIYCLEDYIHPFWNSMPEDLKQSSVSLSSPVYDISLFWYYNMKERRLRTTYRSEFHSCATQGNKAAAEYFLKKLTPSEREASLVEAAKCVEDADVLWFLLSEMDEETQMEFLKNSPYKVLQCFLQWPLKSFFFEIANCIWDFLSKIDYENILTNIIVKISEGYKDWEFFRKFWQESPTALKSFITEEFDKSRLLWYFFHIKDRQYITLILKDATLTVKEKLIFSYQMNSFCQSCILGNEWDILQFTIRECVSSKEEMLKFKEDFEKCEMWVPVEDNLARNKHKWDQLFCLPDDSICKFHKRSAEGESSLSKQFRSPQ